MSVCGIYKFTNKETGECYIGQSIDIYTRLQEHFTEKYDIDDWHTDLQNNPEKYDFEILTRCNKEDLNDEENYYIYKYDSIKHGYNKRKGNYNFFNFHNKENKRENLLQTKINKEIEQYPYTIKDFTTLFEVSAQTIYKIKKANLIFFENNCLKQRKGKPYRYNENVFNFLAKRFK